ncbi:MAG: S41 family peptidase [Alphaproteobacteria bacterium]
MAAALIGVALVGFSAGGLAQSTESTYRQLDLLGDVIKRIKTDYVEEVDDAELIQSAIDGMLTALDPHSRFLDVQAYKDMRTETRGEFGGLGIEVTLENGLVKVITPIYDTPAYRAGMQTGDYITHLDGDPILGLSLNDAVERMRGPIDTDIHLTVVREGVERPFDVTITRALIKVNAVRARREGDIAYVRLTRFNEKVADDLAEAMETLMNDIGSDIEGVILDLRNNPGGLLNTAIAVADAFLEQGEIVSTRGRRADSIQRYNARSGDLAEGLPLVVLINGGSASAAEIVAGALKDHGRALILGTRSFGKGSVQTVIPISEGQAIRLTTARYYTPSGVSIQALGIEPDIVVEQARIEELEGRARSSEADLPQHLMSEGTAEDAALLVSERSAETRSDYQLTRALDLLEGLALLSGRSVN